jgi:hypothetical protein
MLKVKIIHQTWKNNDLENSPFKREWVDSWLENNPNYEYRFWSDADLQAFIEEEYPDFLDVYEEYDKPIKKPDAARYLILKRIGGIYADMDIACLKSFEPLLKDLDGRFMITTEGDPGQPWTFGNSLMACNPNPAFLENIENSFRKKRLLHVLESSACGFMTKRINEGRGNQIYSPESRLLFPWPWCDSNKHIYKNMSLEELKQIFPEAYCANFFCGSWLNQY